MMFPKHKRVRLRGKKIADLNTAIHDRDNNKCVVSGVEVEPGVKFHHVKRGINKEDRIEYGVTLDPGIHWKAHFSKDTYERERINRRCEEYLRGLYPEVWE